MNDDNCSVRLGVSLFLKGGRKKQTSSTFVGKTEAYLQFLDCEMGFRGNCKCAYGCVKGNKQLAFISYSCIAIVFILCSIAVIICLGKNSI